MNLNKLVSWMYTYVRSMCKNIVKYFGKIRVNKNVFPLEMNTKTKQIVVENIKTFIEKQDVSMISYEKNSTLQHTLNEEFHNIKSDKEQS